MRKSGIKFLLLSWMILFAAIQTYGAEAKGYKIVLASFGSFDEAKTALEKLGSKIGASEFALQKEYHFEIAARSSGKAFMLAVEPIETQQGAQSVLREFQKYYPDAYVNGYFGPTQGAIFFKPPETKNQVEEINATEVNTTAKVEKSVAENTSTPVKPEVEVATEEVSSSEESSTNAGWIIAFVLITAVIAVVWKFRRSKEPVKEFKEKYEEAVAEGENEDRVEMIESEAFSVVEEDDTPKSEQPKVFEPERDIFYKLKNNMFFVTLIEELKVAADSKDDQRCHDLVDEVLRYQKNFRKSEMIATMKTLVETKGYDQLSSLITREMAEE